MYEEIEKIYKKKKKRRYFNEIEFRINKLMLIF